MIRTVEQALALYLDRLLLRSVLSDEEKQAILSTIRQLNGDKLMAAKLLGIGKTTLYRKLKEYGIEDEVDDGFDV